MPDLTLCTAEKCPIRDNCKRGCVVMLDEYIHQSYADFSTEPRGPMGECAFYLPIKPRAA